MENILTKCRAFVCAVETGSFTKAAAELHYAQSSVSKMIADLEQEWGVPLLERGRRGVCLTACGQQLLPMARRMLHDHRELEECVQRMQGVQTGQVRIGTFASVAIHWLPNIFAQLQKDCPGIEYEMLLGDYDEVERWIEEGRVDCGFLRLPTTRGFDTVLLKRDEYKVVLPVGHPWPRRRPWTLPHSMGSRFFCWSMVVKRRSRRCWRAAGRVRISASPPGRILPSWPWWSGDSVSVSCPL